MLQPNRIPQMPDMWKETEMTTIDETIKQLTTHYKTLLQQAKELAYTTRLINQYGETIGTQIIIPSGLEQQLEYTHTEIQQWKQHKQQNKQLTNTN